MTIHGNEITALGNRAGNLPAMNIQARWLRRKWHDVIRDIRDCSPFIHGVISWYKRAEVFQRFYKVKSQIYFSDFTLCFTLSSLLATGPKLLTRTENKSPPGCRDNPESESMLGFSVLLVINMRVNFWLELVMVRNETLNALRLDPAKSYTPCS